METDRSPVRQGLRNPHSPLQTVRLLGLVAVAGYLAAKLGGVLIITVPQTLWPMWPGCALVVAVLLLHPRARWPMLATAGLLGFIVYDLEAGVPIPSIAWLVFSDVLEIFAAAWGVSYLLKGQPRLDSLNALVKYLFPTVILASLIAASIGSHSLQGNYWLSWRISVLSEGLAFLTVTPAILGWFNPRPTPERATRATYWEAMVLGTTLTTLCYFLFVGHEASAPPALLYSLVPFLLWSALRFGLTGASTSASIVALLSIWGANHGRGPFTEADPISRIVSLQLFLLSTTLPFMIVAVLADERKSAERAMRESAERFHLAAQAGKMFAYEWDATTDVMVRAPESLPFLGPEEGTQTSGRQIFANCHPDDRGRLTAAAAKLSPETPLLEVHYRTTRPDGTVIWVQGNGRAYFDERGRMLRIIGMVADVTERKRAEDELRTSEEKFRNVFRDAGVGMVIVSPEGRFLSANAAFCECLGYPEAALLQKTVQSITHAEDWPSFSERFREALEQGTSFQRVEKRCLHKSGRVVATESSASLIRGSRNEPRYFVWVVLDITRRKQAEEALSSLSGRLIEAHEEERTWIARELHDDFNQRIALLAINLKSLEKALPVPNVPLSRGIEEAMEQLGDLGKDIQALSHRLHSSKLEYLGLVAACTGLCRELSNRHKVEIAFHSEEIPKNPPQEIALCLFRVLQEALHNAIKHSGAPRFEVVLQGATNELQLSVRDSGVGFDPEMAIAGQGLGLTSMRERLKLVDGQLLVHSKVQGGTTIQARVPLRPKAKSAEAGG